MANGKFQVWVDSELTDAVITGAENMYLTQSGASKRTSLDDLKAWVTATIESSVNVFYPEDFGAVGDAVGAQDGTPGPGNTFSSISYVFQATDVGKSFWPNDGVQRTITAVNSGVATLSSASSGTTNVLWLMATDDTVAIQAALDAARAVQGPDVTEDATTLDQLVRSGGIVALAAGKAYGITNSSAQYSGGKLSCLFQYRRTTFMGAGVGAHRSALVLLPGSYGHMVSSPSPTSFTDFTEIANMTLYGYGPFNPNGLDGLHIELPVGGYDKTDPYHRVYRLTTIQTNRDGFYFKGKGELVVDQCDSFGSGRNGFFFDNVYDFKFLASNAGGNRLTGIKMDSTGAATVTACKSFYSGTNGGSDQKNCANWVLLGNQEGGLVTFNGCMAQESRGSGWYIESGNNVFNGCQGYDPGRSDLGGGTLPTNMAAWQLESVNCRMNTFSDCVASPSATIYQDPNWQPNVSSVYIADVDVNQAGPQLNQGHIWTYRPTINAGGGVRVGTQYSGTGGVKTGGGVTNGKNSDLYIDGVACASLLGATPASGDLIEVVDISDTYSSTSGTKKLVAFSNFGGGGGGMAIGGSITSATAGSVLFAGAAGVLQQDNASLFWDDTTNALGIGTATPVASSILELVSTSKGFLPPRMNTSQRTSISSPATGLVVYDTDENRHYFRNDFAWVPLLIAVTPPTSFDPSRLVMFENTASGFNSATYQPPSTMSADVFVTLPGVDCVVNGSVGLQVYDQTITAGGTTGAQTINKPAGTVNFAAAATTLVVTNSLVTTSSTIYCSVRTNDTTAFIKNVIPAAGSFTIRLEAAATAETSVGFFVIN